VQRLFAAAQEEFRQIDVVVHSAGIMTLAPIIKNDVQEFDRVIATNLRGAFLVLSQAAQYIHNGGRIVALSSSVLAKSFPGYGAYIASKRALKVWSTSSRMSCKRPSRRLSSVLQTSQWKLIDLPVKNFENRDRARGSLFS
jgi:NAD(P)-dependent dehydrogenase (short-subunit alcohol dehydrogenase family)